MSLKIDQNSVQIPISVKLYIKLMFTFLVYDGQIFPDKDLCVCF